MTNQSDPINIAEHRTNQGQAALQFANLIEAANIFTEMPEGTYPMITDGRWDQGEALVLRRILPGLLRDWARTYGGLSLDEVYPNRSRL